MRRRLCKLEEIADPGSKGFHVPAQQLDLFVVRRGDVVRAYRNSCPHTGAPLEWMPDQFLNLEGNLIQCALHGALFQMHDGRCIGGPCVGKYLQGLPVSVRDGEVMLEDDDTEDRR